MGNFNREKLKPLLLSLTEDEYKNKVDLHIHSIESDGILSPSEILEQAKSKGMKYISITDHNNIESYLNSNILADDIVIPSVEFDCLHKGVLIHILGYGIDIDNKEIKNLYADSKLGRKHNFYRIFKLRNPEEVIYKIKQAGGIPVLAHPCCYWCWNLDDFVKSLIDIGIEGLEVFYKYRRFRCIFKFHSINTVKRIAEKYNLIKTGGSDTHGNKL